MAWEVRFKKGVWLPQLGWWLDARHGIAGAVINLQAVLLDVRIRQQILL